jgi:DNA-binding transcriptional regulator of glucitol operon
VLRRLLTPRWLLGLVLTLAAAGAMVRLGQWQLGRGQDRHSLQNYAYAVEWALFAAFAVFCFYKLIREADLPPEDPAEKPDVVLAPPAPADEPQDDELAAYNAYLARLNAEDSS